MAVRKIKLPDNSVVAINDDRLVVTSPSDGQTIAYDSTTGKFVNTAMPDAVSGTNDGTNWTTITIGSTTKAIPSGGGSSTLAGLTDVNLTNQSDKQVLTYDSNTSKWVNAAPTAGSSITMRVWTNNQ